MKGKEYKKPSMRLESNVGMVKGNKKAHSYAEHLRLRTKIKKRFYGIEKCQMQKV